MTHGRPGTYTRGCRCEECRRAWADYQREVYRARHPEQTRRLGREAARRRRARRRAEAERR